jgi:hypothetical protein
VASGLTRVRRAAALGSLLAACAAAGCDGCNERAPEHVVAAPASASAAASSPASAPLTAEERRDVFTRLQPELCEEAARKVNTLNGRAPEDKKGVDLLTRCLRIGNVAWYRCLLNATSVADVRVCHTRLLLPLDELPRGAPSPRPASSN